MGIVDGHEIDSVLTSKGTYIVNGNKVYVKKYAVKKMIYR